MPNTRTYIANTFTILMLASGITGVLCRNILVYTVGANTPGYAAATDYISELSADGAPFETLMNIGSLMMVGAAMILASKALQIQLPGREAALATAYLAISGVSFIGIGLFPCPPGCDPEMDSLRMVIHTLSGFIAALSLSLSALTYGLRFLRRQKSLLTGSALILGITGIIAFSILWSTILCEAYGISTPLSAWKGMFQRINLATGDLWILIACSFTLIVRPPARAPEVFHKV